MSIEVDNEALQKALEIIRPALQAEGGDLTLLNVDEEGRVHIRLKGACQTCPMAIYTLKMGIERFLKAAVPGITEVVAEEENLP
ncbi:MAG: NifU family protein [bacterium]